jgi:hypothetical protein
MVADIAGGRIPAVIHYSASITVNRKLDDRGGDAVSRREWSGGTSFPPHA